MDSSGDVETTPFRAFGRRIEFDERSRNFAVRRLLPGKSARSYTWECPTTLDQGTSYACVGFAWAHELVARPGSVPASERLALALYDVARRLDEWEGENYDGTSVLAGAKAMIEFGYIGSYHWAFTLDELILALGHTGPAILGLNWHAGMMTPDADGFITPTGSDTGGHAILARAVNVKDRYIILRNSWGSSWGSNGDAKIRFDDLAGLLQVNGEACIPTDRRRLVHV